MGLSLMYFGNGIKFQLIRTSGPKKALVFVRELWGRLCLSLKYQETVTAGSASLKATTRLKWVPGWPFP